MSFRHPFATAQPEETRAITVKDIRADAPKFARSYTVKLDDRATLRVTIKSFLGRYSSGELNQPNGRWVFFDPDRIADKILDPVLLPLVERYCKIIRDMDKEFMRGKPNEFTDENGTTWRRVGQ
jgi:hypothetical protein